MIDDIEKIVTYGDGLFAPYGETPDDVVRCIGNNYFGEWCDRYSWNPGNGTKYDLVYLCRTIEPFESDDGRRFGLVYMNGFGREYGTAMEFTANTFIHWTWLMKKLDVNEADAVAILQFLERLGHPVGYPRPNGVADAHDDGEVKFHA